MPTALILSGAGRYADPWHPFPETSARLAALAQESGWRTVITEDVDQQLATGLDEFEMLVVNAGDPWMADGTGGGPTGPQLIEQGRANLSAALARGIAVLGVHTAAASLRDYPEFRQVLGGEWVRDRSWHPPFGELRVTPQPHPITTDCREFTTQDERYTDLDIDQQVEPLATTNGDDRTHLLTWAAPHPTSRIIYHALGHDHRTYDSPGHQRFLRHLLTRLLPAYPMSQWE